MLLPVLFLLNVFEFGALLYAGDADDRFGTGMLLSSPLFWLEVVLGIIVPFVLLLVAGKNRIAVIASGCPGGPGSIRGKITDHRCRTIHHLAAGNGNVYPHHRGISVE